MLKNYFKIALRTIRRHKGYTFINVTGLAVGMAVCLLMVLFVQDELSHDTFHDHADRLYVVGKSSSWGGQTRRQIATPYDLVEVLPREIPEVEAAVQMVYPGQGTVSTDGTTFEEEDRILLTSPAFFEVFSFPLLAGDPKTVLAEPGTVVLSEEMAQKYFPDENPIGQTITIKRYGEALYTITGVAETVTENTFFDFDFAGSYLGVETVKEKRERESSWGASMFVTVALLNDALPPDALDEKLAAMVDTHMGEDAESAFFLKPLTEFYLSDLLQVDGFKGDPRYIYIFSAIALLILLIASINYMNLATARSASRAREVGIRKTLGAGRMQVARQFLGESLLVTLAALVLALVLVELALPAFNALFDMQLDLSYRSNAIYLLALLALALGVGFIAGAYPALHLSGFRPVRVLKGETVRGPSGAWLRRGLVVTQFTISAVLIIGTAIIYQQLTFIQNKNLGFDKEHVLVVNIQPAAAQHEAIKEAFLRNANVLRVAATSGVPGQFSVSYGIMPDVDQPDKAVNLHGVKVDYDYLEMLELELVAGRNFSQEMATDDTTAVILNEAAVRELGWTDPVGKPFSWEGKEKETVVGVVKDFHFQSLHETIGPVMFRIRSAYESWPPYHTLVLRLSGQDLPGTLAFLEDQWGAFGSGSPMKYEFLDEQLDALYRTEQRLSKVFSIVAGLAIFIACLGLFGLAAFTAEQRTKEIGIRKVLGATVTNLVALLSKDFLKLVVVAFVIAAPVAYLAMQRWLADFAYRIEISPTIFLMAGLTALLIALLTVSYQAIRAALADPVQSLRYE
ncbi:MAG TPA: ABC transporter permease [Rhodothermales bacterium]|nr:ABC transporter permease [Rhodothermales bacterium]